MGSIGRGCQQQSLPNEKGVHSTSSAFFLIDSGSEAGMTGFLRLRYEGNSNPAVMPGSTRNLLEAEPAVFSVLAFRWPRVVPDNPVAFPPSMTVIPARGLD